MNCKTTVGATSIACDLSLSFSSRGSIPLISPTNSCERQQHQYQQQQRQLRSSTRGSDHLLHQKQQRRLKDEAQRNASPPPSLSVRENEFRSKRSVLVEEAQATSNCTPGSVITSQSIGPTQEFSVDGEPMVVTPSGPRRSIRTSPPPSLAVSAPTRLFSPASVTAPPCSNRHHHHIVYLIRHGQSRAQVSPTAQRLKDPALQDCGLTNLGRQQALQMSNRYDLPRMDLVMTSPLTRALETSILAFPSSPILVHYELREIGRPDAPENTPRSWDQVLPNLADGKDVSDRIDTESLRPSFPWPDHHNRTPPVLRRQYVQKHVIQWLAHRFYEPRNGQRQQPRTHHIALVCHFHVIRAALRDSRGFCSSYLRPNNAEPILCILGEEGHLIPIDDY